MLGGGLVAGSAVLIGGNPGAGKSTLLLQLLCQLAATQTCLYVTGEESLQQVAMRARRLGLPVDKLHTLSETSIESLLSAAESLSPAVMVVDSIQVMHWPELAVKSTSSLSVQVSTPRISSPSSSSFMAILPLRLI